MNEEDYYESEEWEAIEQANREYFAIESPGITIDRPQLTKDKNWLALQEEKLLPPLVIRSVAKISNCRFNVWRDTNRLMAQYDVAYTNGIKLLDRRLYGTWDKSEPRMPTEHRAYDAILTMIVRSGARAKINFSRMYETLAVTEQIREINLIEINDGSPLKAWFILNDNVYPARYEEDDEKYTWVFNGKKKLSIDRFCDICWKAICQ